MIHSYENVSFWTQQALDLYQCDNPEQVQNNLLHWGSLVFLWPRKHICFPSLPFLHPLDLSGVWEKDIWVGSYIIYLSWIPILAPVLTTSFIPLICCDSISKSDGFGYSIPTALTIILHLCCMFSMMPSISSLFSLVSQKLSSILHYHWLLHSQVYAHLKTTSQSFLLISVFFRISAKSHTTN